MKRAYEHAASLSKNRKVMILSLLLIAASYYSAPFGVILLAAGLFAEWMHSGYRHVNLFQLGKTSIFLIPGIILIISAAVGPLFYGHYWNSLLALLILLPLIFCAVAIEVLWKKEYALHFARYTTMLIIPITVTAFAFPWIRGIFTRYSEHLRFAGTFSNPNYFSYFLEITMLFAIALYYHMWKRSSRIWLSFSFVLSAFCLYLTGSRTGMLAFLVGITIFCLLMSEKVILSVVFGAITIVLVATAIFPEKSVSIFSDVIPRPETFLVEIKYRFMLWDVALKQIAKNPFLGTGLDTYRYLVPKDAPLVLKNAIHSHNIFINFWLETGVLGFASFIWIFIRVIARAIKVLKTSNVRPYLSAGIAMIAVTAVHGIMDAPLVSSQTISLFGLLLGCIVVMSRNEQSFILHNNIQ
ncbi:MAG: O-antigen ligase family protein [Saccharofermentanales bacterium]